MANDHDRRKKNERRVDWLYQTLDSSGSHFDCSLQINNNMMLTAYILSGARTCGKELPCPCT